MNQVSYRNFNLIVQHADQRAEAFCVIKKYGEGKKLLYEIKKNNLFKELFLRAKHAIGIGAQSHRDKLHSVIEANVLHLNQNYRKAHLKKTCECEGACNDHPKTYTKLFITAQKYNHAIAMSLDPVHQKEARLFKDLSLKSYALSESCPEAMPIKINLQEIARSKMKVPKDQRPYIRKRGRHKFYHYNEKDTQISHSKEAAFIFISTQRERVISLVGRIVENIAHIFKHKIHFFEKYHYFKNSREKSNHIYAKDAPLAETNQPTSYWIGHATCFLSIPLKSDTGSRIPINIITDPVEGDLNKILYPRMTRVGKPIASCPLPHIYMLSHNHLDHYNAKTIKRLKKFQPIMLIPKGDLIKFQKLGFKHVYEHNWWQSTTIPVEQGDQKAEIKITAVPANHWSGGEPGTAHKSATVGYIIHSAEGDIYFAGDTARLSEQHITTLRDSFNIRSMFQPGGPDEIRKHMKSTHQASADGIWMHVHLMLENLHRRGNYSQRSKEAFMEDAKKLRTLYMHTKTFKLGNLHFDDTDKTVENIKKALEQKTAGGDIPPMKDYEEQVCDEILAISENLKFSDQDNLTSKDLLELINEGVIIPKIGSRTTLV